jgi:hypothetical protein
MRSLTALVALLFAACGGPALQNVPKPDPAIMAGVAAGVAGAATLADPDGAAKRQEQKKPVREKRPMKSGGTVPGDVFDRLDAKQNGTAPAEQPEPTAPPEETSEIRSPVPLKK